MSSTQTWKVRHRVVVPGRHRQSVMKLAHDCISSGHVGAAKTLAKVKDQFIWPAMSRDIKRYCARCPICQRLGKGVKVFKAPPKAPPRDQSTFPVCCRGFCRTSCPKPVPGNAICSSVRFPSCKRFPQLKFSSLCLSIVVRAMGKYGGVDINVV